jgi:hypothetical protein
MEDGTLQKNAILLDFKNFNITEVGDVQDLVDDTSAIAGVSLSNETHNLPNI